MNHNGLTWFLAVVFAALTVFVTYVVFTSPPDVPSGTAAAFSAFLGFPSIIFGLYKWSHEKDPEK